MAKRKSTPTLVTFLLDRTGSMQSIKDDTIGAFNAYLETLKAGGEPILFSFLQFDSMSVDRIAVKQPVAEVAELTAENYIPRASTPLIDAAYETIEAVAASDESATSRVIICIQTDGQENASVRHTWAELNALIKEKAALGWQFNFMGAGIDAYAQGAKMGISALSTMSYKSNDRAATRAAFTASAQNTTMFASGRAASTAYSMAQRTQAKDSHIPADLQSASAKPLQAQRLVDKISL